MFSNSNHTAIRESGVLFDLWLKDIFNLYLSLVHFPSDLGWYLLFNSV